MLDPDLLTDLLIDMYMCEFATLTTEQQRKEYLFALGWIIRAMLRRLITAGPLGAEVDEPAPRLVVRSPLGTDAAD